MDVNLEKLVHLTPPEGADEALVCGPDGCAPVPAEPVESVESVESSDGEGPGA